MHKKKEYARRNGGCGRLQFISFYIATNLMNIDLLFVKAMVIDNAKTGFYTSATTLARTPYFIFIALSATLLPSISKSIANNDFKLTNKYINQSLRYLLLLLIPGTLLVSATSKNFYDYCINAGSNRYCLESNIDTHL